jgi:hypothetical protein
VQKRNIISMCTKKILEGVGGWGLGGKIRGKSQLIKRLIKKIWSLEFNSEAFFQFWCSLVQMSCFKINSYGWAFFFYVGGIFNIVFLLISVQLIKVKVRQYQVVITNQRWKFNNRKKLKFKFCFRQKKKFMSSIIFFYI